MCLGSRTPRDPTFKSLAYIKLVPVTSKHKHHSHLDKYCGSPLVKVSNPASRACPSARVSGRFSKETIHIAQYAPLFKRQKLKLEIHPVVTYRTSSSPPSQTRNPPSGCLTRLSHCHLHQSDAHHARKKEQLTSRVDPPIPAPHPQPWQATARPHNCPPNAPSGHVRLQSLRRGSAWAGAWQ